MAIATLAAVQSIRLGLPAYSSKALTDVKNLLELWWTKSSSGRSSGGQNGKLAGFEG